MFNDLDEMFLDQYDYEATKVAVFDVFKKYEIAKYKFIELSAPKITSSYEIDYTINELRKSNPTEKQSFLLLDTEEKLEKFYTVISKLSEQLNYYEKCYLVCCLYEKQTEEDIADRIGVSRPTFRKWKRTCIIKCGLSFGVAVPK